MRLLINQKDWIGEIVKLVLMELRKLLRNWRKFKYDIIFLSFLLTGCKSFVYIYKIQINNENAFIHSTRHTYYSEFRFTKILTMKLDMPRFHTLIENNKFLLLLKRHLSLIFFPLLMNLITILCLFCIHCRLILLW